MLKLWQTLRKLIRRMPLLLSTLLGSILLLIGIWTYFSPVYFERRIGTKNIFYIYLADEFFRLSWLQCDEPIRLAPLNDWMLMRRTGTNLGHPLDVESLDGTKAFGLTIRHPSQSELHRMYGSWIRTYFEFRLLEVMGTASTQHAPLYRSFVRVPLWVLIPLLYLYPILVIFGKPARRRRRRRRGLCIECAYDLRGNISGRCPECGTATDWKVGPT